MSKEGHKTEFNNTSANEWNIGVKVEPVSIKKHGTKGCSAQAKYSYEYETQFGTSFEKSITYTTPIEMFEGTQENGRFLYVVPSIKRYSYEIYPWWAGSADSYAVPGSFNYQFVTSNQTPLCRPVPLKQFPFKITEPNEPLLKQWILTERPDLYNAVYQYSPASVVSIAWQSGGNGGSEDLEVVSDTTSVTSITNAWAFDVKVGLNLDVPAIASNFNISISTGTRGKITNETTTLNSYTSGISASLENLVDTADGIKIGYLVVEAYMLDPKDAPYWYLDSCGGQRPWYLAWVVSDATQKINLVSPSNNDRVDSSGAIFSWTPDFGELHDYEFFISKKARVDGPSAIYRKKMGDETNILVSDFKPEPGVTYYWRVRGIDANRNFIWSPTWKIVTPATLPEPTVLPSLKTVIYPNPGNRSEMKFIVNPEQDGPVSVSLLTLDGIRVARQELTGQSGVPVTFGFADTDLAAGIYFAVISSGDIRTVKKVIIH